ncbi:MAG: T9SS type A sorting domain-containing protein [Bacteroidota bacterium]
MRKITLVLIMMLTFSGISMAQVIEDFESLKMNIFSAGANGALTIVPNPDPTGINTSANVVKMVRGFDGDPWAGWYATMETPVDVTANKYVHVKVWKPRISPDVFKYEGTVNSGDVYPIQDQTLVNQWEELVFDMSIVSGEYVKIVLIPDFESPLTLTEDITLYFDDLYANNDPAVGSAPVQVIENYENIALNLMLNGELDQSNFMISPNPDPSGVNVSPYVTKFLRDKDGSPWDGFWSSLPEVIDVTTNKFIHVKVWKPRVSTLKFKIEGGAAGTIEIESKYPQLTTNAWEDIVFDFTEKTGTYPIIAFLPDYSDPVNLTEDITLYIDDIILNNDPNPIGPPKQIFHVDMSALEIPEGTQVFISGAIGGIHGTWNEPGTNTNNEMFDTNGDKIYTIEMSLADGVIAFKFFVGAGWGNGETIATDRTYQIEGSCDLTFKWSDLEYLAIPDNPLSGKVQMFPNPVSNELTIKATADISTVTITSMLGQVVGNYEFNTTGNQTINTSAFNNGMYFVTFTGKDGSKLTQKLMKN